MYVRNHPRKNTPGICFQQSLQKRPCCGSGSFCAKIGQIGACRWACRSMSQHVAGHVAACRSMSLGMSQHVAACRWACRSMSRRFLCASLGMSQHFVPLLGVLRHFAGVWANFWPKSQFSGLASAPPCFSDSPRAQTSGGFSVFRQRGIGLKEGDFTLQRESKDFSAVAL